MVSHGDCDCDDETVSSKDCPCCEMRRRLCEAGYTVECPHCGGVFKYLDPREGGTIDCLYCGREVSVPYDVEIQ